MQSYPQKSSHSDLTQAQNINMSTSGPRLFNRFILGQPAGQSGLCPSTGQPLQSNSNVMNQTNPTFASKSSVSLQVKGSNFSSQPVSTSQGFYKSKENNSGAFPGGSALRQRNTVYISSNTNSIMPNNVSSSNGNTMHKPSGSIGAVVHRGSSGGKPPFGYCTQEANRSHVLISNSRSNGNMVSSVDEK
jgi:hypothetical protein